MQSNLILTKAPEVGHSSLNIPIYQVKIWGSRKLSEWNLEFLSPSLAIFPLCPTLDHERYYKSDSYIVWGLERVSYYGVKDLLPD